MDKVQLASIDTDKGVNVTINDCSDHWEIIVPKPAGCATPRVER